MTVDCFNQNFTRLIESLATIVPSSIIGQNVGIIVTYINSPMTETKAIEAFQQFLLPHKQHIMSENEKFLLEFDIASLPGMDFWAQTIFQELISMWKLLNKTNKQMVFLYLKGLTQLAEHHHKSTLN